MIRVEKIEVRRAHGRFATGVPAGTGRVEEYARAHLALGEGAGRVGRGEASPLAGFSPDSFARAAEALESLRPGSLTLDLARPLPPQVAALLEAVPASVPSARFALETALLDLAGQALGLPLSALLGGPARQPRPLAIAELLVGETVDEIETAARRAIDRGTRTVKMKVASAKAFEAALEAGRRLRADLEGALAMRFDANRAFEGGEIVRRLEALAALAPEFVEEPASPRELASLGELPVALGFDESLAEPDGRALAIELARRGRGDVFVLKPTILGGLFACLDLAKVAREVGARTVVSHTFEGSVARAATLQLALALPETLAPGLGNPEP